LFLEERFSVERFVYSSTARRPERGALLCPAVAKPPAIPREI
jgi:hypothetical protein